ncbi:sensor histidine kinase [Ornithinibacillus sp. L9]|uniref:histidine kinase n=1 Tax=Ornithinibacillus caprae TaxID=2678566 RepID=A0A6N8FLS1_9BACI|nr:sensor histidine kinase [Ornithinibacillus caprae]MUK88937.1 sensor histidine kinase [Ornithinibacillus caprae]
MKLFFKENTLLICTQALQFFIIMSIYWLDGYQNVRPALYAVFLGFFLLGCYLFYHYISRRKFYKRLSEPLQKLDDSLQKTEIAPLAIQLDELLKNQYKLYQTQIKALQQQQMEHLQFIDQWVHQMKTPLSVIELTAQGLDEPDSSSIREETYRMKTGLNTILYMARLRSIEQDLHVKPVVLAKIINEVNGENKRFYIRNKVYPKLIIKNNAITVETDEKWLFFILTQLTHNAVKYSAEKSNQIVINVYEKNSEAIVEVTDHGVGIPNSDKKRVFDAFFTGENGRQFRESTGIGLYITKEVIQHLGHRIELESEVGNGTTFRIIFTSAQNLTTL